LVNLFQRHSMFSLKNYLVPSWELSSHRLFSQSINPSCSISTCISGENLLEHWGNFATWDSWTALQFYLCPLEGVM
jgi:hypothetical protein